MPERVFKRGIRSNLERMAARGTQKVGPTLDLNQSSFFQKIVEERRASGHGPSPKVKPAWEDPIGREVLSGLAEEIRKAATVSDKATDGFEAGPTLY